MTKHGKFWCTAEGGIASGESSCFQQWGPYCETCVARVSLQHAGEVDEDSRELGHGAEGVRSKGTKARGKLREVYKCFSKRGCLEIRNGKRWLNMIHVQSKDRIALERGDIARRNPTYTPPN